MNIKAAPSVKDDNIFFLLKSQLKEKNMKIVACYKCVPQEEEIVVRNDHKLDLSKSEWKIGQYDLNAVEAGMKLIEEAGGEMLVLTAADEIADNSKLRKGILSRGPQQMYGVKDDSMRTADSYAIALALKIGIEKIGGADLVLCGEGSGDIYSQQVGSVLGALLSWPTVNAVSKITQSSGKLLVERSLENGVEVLEVNLPAVISVTSDINIPRIPTMKEILGAGKKQSESWNLSEIGVIGVPGSETISILAPDQTDRQRLIFEGDGEESINALYDHLRKIM
jgi:electron transfer flavoprotein beta subunit